MLSHCDTFLTQKLMKPAGIGPSIPLSGIMLPTAKSRLLMALGDPFRGPSAAVVNWGAVAHPLTIKQAAAANPNLIELLVTANARFVSKRTIGVVQFQPT